MGVWVHLGRRVISVMPPFPRIGLVGDFDASVPAHQAIPLALGDRAEGVWVPTETIRTAADLEGFDGIWWVPASPYRSMDGALTAIRFARETGLPFLGTCGGFQHAVIEYARNVLGWADAEHGETSPEATRVVVSPLACSLVEASDEVRFTPGSRLEAAYGAPESQEGYRCRFGLNPTFREAMLSGTLRVAAIDAQGEVRGIELEGHPFFLATLFQPERAALAGKPTPLVDAFVTAASRRVRAADAIADYLKFDETIDGDHPSIVAFLRSSGWDDLPEIERTRAAYEYVRDEIPHAWDVQSEVVTCSASEVLERRVGICYAKSHLLAALLRGLGIPAGLSYQRLVLFDDPEDGFAIHALNGAYLNGRWVRMDSRGNKPGVDAQFSLDEERLAFRVQPEKGEEDERIVYATPAACTVAALSGKSDMSTIYRQGLPSRLR